MLKMALGYVRSTKVKKFVIYVLRSINALFIFYPKLMLKLQCDPSIEKLFSDFIDIEFIKKYYYMSIKSANLVSNKCNKIIIISYSISIPFVLSYYGIVKFDKILGIEISNIDYIYEAVPIVISFLLIFYCMLLVKKRFIISRINAALNAINPSIASPNIYSHFIESGPYGLSEMLESLPMKAPVLMLNYIAKQVSFLIVEIPLVISIFPLAVGRHDNLRILHSGHVETFFVMALSISFVVFLFYSIFVGVNYVSHRGIKPTIQLIIDTYRDIYELSAQKILMRTSNAELLLLKRIISIRFLLFHFFNLTFRI